MNSNLTFLRRALIADAVTSAAAGLALIAAVQPLATLFGLPSLLLLAAGGVMLAWALHLSILVRRPFVSRRAALRIIVLNLVWLIASLALLASGWVEPTALGFAFVAVQALAGGVFAELQFVGMRRLPLHSATA
jgi:hypothetical protein